MSLRRLIPLVVTLLIGAAVLISLPSCASLQRAALPVAEATQPAALFRVPMASQEKTIILTIDDGPSPRTAEILDILARYDATATFFLHTDYITEETDALVRQLIQEGHEVAHHMPADRPYREDSAAAFAEAFAESDTRLRDYGDAAKPFFRPPQGAYHRERMDPSLHAGGYDDPLGDGGNRRYIMASFIPWDAARGQTDTDDADLNRRRAEKYARRLAANLFPGAIVIFHDGITPGREPRFESTLISLELFLSQAGEKGWKSVRLSDAVSAPVEEHDHRVEHHQPEDG